MKIRIVDFVEFSAIPIVLQKGSARERELRPHRSRDP